MDNLTSTGPVSEGPYAVVASPDDELWIIPHNKWNEWEAGWDAEAELDPEDMTDFGENPSWAPWAVLFDRERIIIHSYSEVPF